MRRLATTAALLIVVFASAAMFQAVDAAQQAELLRATSAPPNAIWLDSLDLTKMVQRRQTPRAGRTLGGGERGGAQDAPITLGGTRPIA